MTSNSFPRPLHNPFEWKGEENATRTRLPTFDGFIAAVRARPSTLNFSRFNAGTLSHSPLQVFHNVRGYLANFLHVSVSFVARFHEVKHEGKDGQRVVKEGPCRVDV